jgi:hypothetical protein
MDYRTKIAKHDGVSEGEGEDNGEPLQFTKGATKVFQVLKNARKEFTHHRKEWELPPQVSYASRILRHERFALKEALIVLFVALRQIGCRVLYTDVVRYKLKYR